MESIHNPDTRKWISKKINLESYFDRMKTEVDELKLVKSSCYETPSLLELNQMIGIKEEAPQDLELTLKQIKEATSLDLLNIEPEETEPDPLAITKDHSTQDKLCFRKYNACPIPKNGPSKLQTLRYQELYLEKSKVMPRLEQRRKTLYPNMNQLWFECRPNDPEKLNTRLFMKEMLLVVRIYRPFKKDSSRFALNSRIKYSQEFYVLGQNKLTELRDCIKCALDYSVSRDHSENPNAASTSKTGKELYKSGFFFINDCFYNDMRWPDCIDYSEVIRKWAMQPGRNLGKLSTAKMEDTYFKDLDIRLGYPYVYVHQGEHEHLFSFVDARLLSANDPQDASQYPFTRSVGLRIAKNCMMCSAYTAKWITTNNERVPEDPFYFCEQCFLSFNYDKDDKKIGRFKAFRYVDDNAL